MTDARLLSFRQQDDLIAASPRRRDQPNLALAPWFAEAGGGLPDKVEAIFRNFGALHGIPMEEAEAAARPVGQPV